MSKQIRTGRNRMRVYSVFTAKEHIGHEITMIGYPEGKYTPDRVDLICLTCGYLVLTSYYNDPEKTIYRRMRAIDSEEELCEFVTESGEKVVKVKLSKRQDMLVLETDKGKLLFYKHLSYRDKLLFSITMDARETP